MKKNLINTLLLGGFILGVASCDVNDWNNHLDGFGGEPEITDKQSIEYTLTEADYATLAANKENVTLAGKEFANELKTVGTKFFFTENITAKKYVPALLSDPNFPYFTLDEGSAILLTYNVSKGLPAEISAVEGAGSHKVQDYEYQDVWGSEEDYIAAFSPSKKPSNFIGGILDAEYPDATADDYMLVEYKMASQEPVFSAKPEEAFEPTDVLKTVKVGDNVTVKGTIVGLCGRGYVLADKGGAILVYYASGFVLDDWNMGDQVELTGTVGEYNKGLQIDGLTATASKVGSGKVVLPNPVVYTGADFDQIITRETSELGVYAKFDCIVSAGKFVNFIIDGAENAQGSLYQGTAAQKAACVDGAKATVTGWFLSISGGRYANFVVTSINGAEVNKKGEAKARKSSVDVVTSTEYAVYKFDGSNWKSVNSVMAVSQADYRSMGQKYNNFSSAADADFYLPKLMMVKNPYAQIDDTQILCYYIHKGEENILTCDQYKFNGNEWVKDNGVVTEVNQFVKKNGKWMYDPNVTLVLPAGKAQELSTLYFQACTDWVWENIDQPAGVTEKGKGYVTKHGDNEYYCGTSAYQGNVDLRAAKAKEQNPTAYEGKTDEEVVALMKERFAKEVMPGALAKIHPDAVPVEGMEVLYTITFGTYDGANATHTIVYKVVDKAKFEFVSCTWDKPAN